MEVSLRAVSKCLVQHQPNEHRALPDVEPSKNCELEVGCSHAMSGVHYLHKWSMLYLPPGSILQSLCKYLSKDSDCTFFRYHATFSVATSPKLR